MNAKQLIDGASFGPSALRAIGEAFDAAWKDVAGSFGNDAAEVEAPRLRLAKAFPAYLALPVANWRRKTASGGIMTIYRTRYRESQGATAMQQTLVWVKTWTAVWVLIALVAAFVTGAVLRVLVRRSAIHPSHALRVIESISVVAGGAVGSVIVLVLLIIL